MKLNENLFVLVVMLKDKSKTDNALLKFLRNELESIIMNGKCFIYQDSLVMLICQHSKIPIDDKLLIQLTKFMNDNNLVSGISHSFSEIINLKVHYQQACEAIKIGMYFKKGERFFEYNNYRLFHLFEIASKHIDLKNFCDPVLFEIISYDQKYQTNYAYTLYMYLMCNQKPVATAHKLKIHRNTIDYRINNISTLFNIQIEDSNVVFSLNLSFKILLNLGELRFNEDAKNEVELKGKTDNHQGQG